MKTGAPFDHAEIVDGLVADCEFESSADRTQLQKKMAEMVTDGPCAVLLAGRYVSLGVWVFVDLEKRRLAVWIADFEADKVDLQHDANTNDKVTK